MSVLLTWIVVIIATAVYGSVTAFTYQAISTHSRATCTPDHNCEDGGHEVVGFFAGVLWWVGVPMYVIAKLAQAKRIGVPRVQRDEQRRQRELDEATHRAAVAQQNELAQAAESRTRIAQIEATNAELGLLQVNLEPVRAE